MKTATTIFLFRLIFGVRSLPLDLKGATYQVSVQRHDPSYKRYEHLAVGAAIASEWILTVAEFLPEQTQLPNFLVLAGSEDATIRDDQMEELANMIRRINKYHVDDVVYSKSSMKDKMALLQLENKFDSSIRAIDLCYDPPPNFGNDEVRLYRWGKEDVHRFLCFGSWRTRRRPIQNRIVLESSGVRKIYTTTLPQLTGSVEGAIVVLKSAPEKLVGVVSSTDEKIDIRRTLTILPLIHHRDFIRDRIPELESKASAQDDEIERNVQASEFQACLYYRLAYKGMATILSMTWIITTATVFNADKEAKNYEAVAGVTSSNVRESTMQRSPCQIAFIDSKYTDALNRGDTNYRQYNFAMVKLRKPFQQTEYVNAIPCLWNTGKLAVTNAKLYSWAIRRTTSDTVYRRLVVSSLKMQHVRTVFKRAVKNEETDEIEIQEMEVDTLGLEVPDWLTSDVDSTRGASVAYDDQLLGFVAWSSVDENNVIDSLGILQVGDFEEDIKSRLDRAAQSAPPVRKPIVTFTDTRPADPSNIASGSGISRDSPDSDEIQEVPR